MNISSSNYASFSIGIIGAGKLGGVLAKVFGSKLSWIVAHSEKKKLELNERFRDIPIYTSINEITESSDVIFLTVPDRSIKESANEVSAHFGAKGACKVVIHCSGSQGLAELASCRTLGMEVIAAHPFQTFIGEDTSALREIAWGIECEQGNEEFAKALIRNIGGIPFILSDKTVQNKAIYHATAVVASNFVTMLMEVAREFAEAAGIDNQFLEPIIKRAVKNSLESLRKNEPPPLTGPIARADITTLELHRKSLENTPLWELYSILSRATAITAFRNDIITSDEYEVIKNVVKE